ncbi:TapY2 family type IVa secretion system protein [Aeromonas bivalvium]|uniref:TapY2 family type IVa secretion system protein n=1 Tax=Aeromonas bivalvium TaxID=440079 RepID=UPI0038D1709A
MRLIPWVCVLGLGLSGGSQAADIKCYVELANGQRVVLSGTMADASPAAVQDKFQRKGYEVDGVIQPVVKVLECLDMGDRFKSKEAQQQDAIQLR